jgi:hypothetical protein
MATIYPTGTCFDDVLDHQSAVFMQNPHLVLHQFIVHGICLMPEGPHKDQPYAHAWVEDEETGLVWQSGLIEGVKVWFGTPRTDWFPLMRVQRSTRYTFMEAMRKNWQTNHYGPWDESYVKLCR